MSQRADIHKHFYSPELLPFLSKQALFDLNPEVPVKQSYHNYTIWLNSLPNITHRARKPSEMCFDEWVTKVEYLNRTNPITPKEFVYCWRNKTNQSPWLPHQLIEKLIILQILNKDMTNIQLINYVALQLYPDHAYVDEIAQQLYNIPRQKNLADAEERLHDLLYRFVRLLIRHQDRRAISAKEADMIVYNVIPSQLLRHYDVIRVKRHLSLKQKFEELKKLESEQKHTRHGCDCSSVHYDNRCAICRSQESKPPPLRIITDTFPSLPPIYL